MFSSADFGFGSPFFWLTQAVRVPVRVGLDVVDRSAEPVGAALGDGRDLQSARPAEFRLIALREDLDLADRLDVHVEHLAVVAGVHGRDAVHHDVVLAGAAEPRAAGRRAVRTTPGVSDVRLVKFAAVDRQVLDLRRS